MYTKKILLIAVFLGLGFYNGCRAEIIGISIDQTIYTFELDPGARKEFTLKVQNIAQEEQQLSVETQDFSAEDNNEITLLPGQNELYGMKDWVAIQEKDVFLEPGGARELQFVLNVPQDATVGSHFCVLNVRALPKIDAQNFQEPIVSGQIAVYILLNVNGDISAKGELTQFVAPVFAQDRVALKSEFQNTGNVFYIPHGGIRIENLFTGQTNTLKTEKHFVFPGKKYFFDMEWAGSSIFGVYKAQAYFVDGEGAMHSSERYIVGKLSFVFPLAVILLVFAANRVIVRYKKRSVKTN